MMYSLLNKRKSCEICEKPFANGKALGGHMRSHYPKLSVQCRESEPEADSTIAPTMPLLQTSNKLGAHFTPRKMRSVYNSEVVVIPKSDLSEEIGQQIAGKKRIFVDLDELNSRKSQRSSQDDQTALCLIEMSKRTRAESSPKKAVMDRLKSTQKEKYTEKYIEMGCDYDDEESYYRYLDQDDDDKKDEDVNFLPSNVRNLTEDKDEKTDTDDDDDSRACFLGREQKCKKVSERKCDICGKVLLSYHALGGHRSSHTNKRLKDSKKNDKAVEPGSRAVVRGHFECQICGRVFESGQALGGHKKAHFVFLKPIN